MTEAEIGEIVDREACAWDNQNLEMLMSVFHQDMVWPWPRTIHSHDKEEVYDEDLRQIWIYCIVLKKRVTLETTSTQQ